MAHGNSTADRVAGFQGSKVAAPALRYVASSRWLHWIMAALMAVVIVVGIWIKYFEPASEPFKMRLYNLHESLGVVVFVLVLVRLVNRWRHPPPPLPAGTPALIHFAASATHMGLYALLVLMPVIGFLATNAWGFPLTVFGVLPMPVPLGKNEELAKLLSLLHLSGAIAVVMLIGGHLMGVLYHTFVRRDGLLRRMM
ncbi:MAG: cytochrome b [Burkholderiaceae bacterium]|nr:cytochrome b [Burkholderiaceae bacterium]